MDLKEKAEQTKRDIAQLKESCKYAERALAALKDKHERTEGENLVRELDHLQDQRKLEILRDNDRLSRNGARQAKRFG